MNNVSSNINSRLFLALWLDIATQQAIQAQRNQCIWPANASLVRPESLHLTLHFLGNVPDTRLSELTQQLRVAVHPFELRLNGIQMWPHGIAVLKPDNIPDELLRLHSSLAVAIQSLGLPTEERPYRPHITLARHAADAVFPVHTQDSIRWRVQGYALAKSQAGQYTLLQQYF
jgi:RNA 2',3'-cyclic 3'-phosphodiesterase